MTKEQPTTYYSKFSGELYKYVQTTTHMGIRCSEVYRNGKHIYDLSPVTPEDISIFGEVQITEEEYEDLMLIKELMK